MLTVGLTGGIASGKSTVAGYLGEFGAVCADADLIAHAALAQGTDVYRQLITHFGSRIQSADGNIDRRRLAEIVFVDPDELEYLNGLVHPVVISEVSDLVSGWRQAAGTGVGIVQVPLLVEAGMTGMFDIIVVVVASPEHQIERLMRAGFTLDEGLARLKSQLPESERLAHADLTLINKGDIDLLKEKTAVLYGKLKDIACAD